MVYYIKVTDQFIKKNGATKLHFEKQAELVRKFFGEMLLQKHLPEPHRKTCSALNPGTEADEPASPLVDLPCHKMFIQLR